MLVLDFWRAGAANAQIVPFTQDFESLDQMDVDALANDGWLVFGNVFDNNQAYQYGYGSFPAPNDGAAFCAIDTGQGGPPQGAQQLSIYCDYNNMDMNNLDWLVEANTFKEWIIDASDVGKTYTFTFDAKLGNLVAPSQAYGFIKIIDSTTVNLNGEDLKDTSAIPTTWGTFFVQMTIDPAWVGDIFQIGFLAAASNFEASGVFYDNLILEVDSGDTGVGNNYCVANANSTGSPALMSGEGSNSVAANNLTLVAGPAPNQPGIFFYGPNQIALPFGNGFRCVGGTVIRLDVIGPTAGEYRFTVDNTMLPSTGQLTNGSTWNFQAWYRDPAGGGAAFDLSNGLEITFVP